MIVSYPLSIRNNKDFIKPNEDYYVCDDVNNIYIVMDGVSRDKENGVYPKDSPSFKCSKIFSDFVLKYLKNNICSFDDIEHLLYCAMVAGNEEIAKFNKKYIGDFLPGTVGIVSLIIENMFYYAYIGDCYGLKISNSKEFFTTPQTKLIHEHIKEFSAYQIRNEICNNINHPYSYGVLNGNKKAEDFFIIDKFILNDVQSIFLFSDGFEPYIKSKSPNELLKLNILNMNIHEDYSSDDDKTIIKIEIG